MKKFTIIVAGGSGQRMKSEVPKQFLLLNGRPVLMHTIQKFSDFDPGMTIVLVLPESQTDHWKALCEEYSFSIPHLITAGGETRFHSVKAGLGQITLKEEVLVAIHDGVRPLVSNKVIEECFKKAEEMGNAVPVITCNDSVRIMHGAESKIIDRNTIKLVQTPQVFRNSFLQKAYAVEFKAEFTDDASVVEKDGSRINLVEGNTENIKITTPIDLLIAEKLTSGTFF